MCCNVGLQKCARGGSVTPTPLGTLSSLAKPLPRLRWRTLDQDTIARQNTPALQANCDRQGLDMETRFKSCHAGEMSVRQAIPCDGLC